MRVASFASRPRGGRMPSRAAMTSSSAVGGTLTATRSTGTAPLGVSFEVTGNGEFNDARTWDFGDTGAGTWAISGLSKNAETDGAVVAHVFETAGSYTVSVSGLTIGITVDDPNTVFSGANTICVSPSANYTGAPGGATLQTSLPSSYAGKRVLLHRGESFGSISPLNTDSGFQVGAYGTGADPIVTSVGTGMVSGVSSWTNDWTIMDIDAGNVSISATTYRFLMYRCTADTVNGVSIVDIGSAVGYYYANVSGAETIPWPREIFLVDNTLTGVVNATNEPAVVLMGSFLKSGIMGNSINLATEHTTRIWSASKTFIGHNDLGGVHYDGGAPPGIRHAFKMHSGGVQDYGTIFSDSPTPATSKVVIAYNHLGDSAYNGSWISQVSPQNTLETEGIEDVLIVGNAFERGPYTSSDMQLRGRRMTWRGNTVVGGGSVNIARSGSTYPSGLDAWDGPYTAE